MIRYSPKEIMKDGRTAMLKANGKSAHATNKKRRESQKLSTNAEIRKMLIEKTKTKRY